MASVLAGHHAVSAKQLHTGEAVAFPVQAGQLIQIIDLTGKQVAVFTAIAQDHQLSTAVTLSSNASVLLKVGDSLYSQRQEAMFEIVDDTVKRHDLLTAPLQKGTASNAVATRDAMVQAADELGLDGEALPAPISFFKHVVIKQRGELEVKDALSERNDTIVLKAKLDTTVVVANAYAEKKPGASLTPGTAVKPGTMLVRVYRHAG